VLREKRGITITFDRREQWRKEHIITEGERVAARINLFWEGGTNFSSIQIHQKMLETRKRQLF